MLGPERQSKSYGAITRVLEATLKQPLNLTSILQSTRMSYLEGQEYVDYLCNLGLLESMLLFTGSRDLGSKTRVYWTSYRGKLVLAHIEAMKRLVQRDDLVVP